MVPSVNIIEQLFAEGKCMLLSNPKDKAVLLIPNSVVSLFWCWNHSGTIVLLNGIEICNQFPLEFNRFI